MRDHGLTKWLLALTAVVSLPLSSPLAQDPPKSEQDQSFDIEPPLLVKPWKQEHTPEPGADEASLDPAQLVQRLERAKRSAVSAGRLVRSGVLSKTEAEQRALRVVRLKSQLARAQLVAAHEQLTSQKARLKAGQATQAEVDAASATVTQATAAAQAAAAIYHKAQLDAAELNLRRQRKLLKLGSAHQSDVARAEKNLARLQQGAAAPR